MLAGHYASDFRRAYHSVELTQKGAPLLSSKVLYYSPTHFEVTGLVAFKSRYLQHQAEPY